jgi:hypothetical protein
VGGTLSALHASPHLILITTIHAVHSYQSHFTGEKSEAEAKLLVNANINSVEIRTNT